jgi:fibronectin type 3 domain-containing protein
MSSSSTVASDTPPVFIENRGQWDSSIRYALRGQGSTVLMSDTGPIFQVWDKESDSGKQFFAEFDGANTVVPKGLKKSSAKFNFFVGDQSDWRSGVSGYEQIVYNGLYDGIDLHTWGKSSSLKYEFHVAAGADYSQISISYNGIKGLSIDSKGKLHINTGFGELVDDAPFVYQNINGKQVAVEASFKLLDHDSYTFAVTGKYDSSKELIIDPNIDWSSYIGGTGVDTANAIAVGINDNSFVVGTTDGVDFTVAGGFDTIFGGETDAFIARYSPTGPLQYITFYGGIGAEAATAAVSDPTDGLYIVGTTTSTDLGVVGGFDTTFGGGVDAFVLKMGREDGTFVWGSYLGGIANDRARGVDLDGTGNIYVTGDTESSDFPTTVNLDQTLSGTSDAFLTKITNGTPPAIAWSTYFGGTGTDTAKAVTLSTPRVSIVGTTTSATELATAGALDTSFNGGTDAFVATLDTSAGTITWATYVGGAALDEGNGIDVDGTGQLYFTGSTNSTDFPLGAGFDPVYKGGGDAYLVTLAPAGTLVFSSFIGGSGNDVGNAVNIAPNGNIVVVGVTSSTDMTTLEPVQTGYGGGTTDGFIVNLTALNVVVYQSYVGGNGADSIAGVDVQNSGDAIVVGATSSTDLLVTGPDTALGGTSDGFISHLSPNLSSLLPATPTELVATAVSMTEIDLRWTDNSSNELGFELLRRVAGGQLAVIATLPRNTRRYADKGLQPSTTYFYVVRSFNRAGSGLDSAEASAKTKTAGLHKPTGLATTPVSAHRIDLKWRDNSDNESNFEIYRALQSDGIFSLIATLAAGTLTYKDQTGLAVGTTYLYRVRATNAFRTSRFSEQVAGTTKDADFIAAPTGLSVNHTSDTTNVLSWTDNADNEVRFSIERTVAGEDDFQEIGSTGPNVSVFTDVNGVPGEIYFYRVQAVHDPNVSDFSNIAASDLEAALAAPTFLEALSVSWDQIKLTWIDNALIETGQIIERALNKPTGWAPIATVDADANAFYDKHVQTGRRYYYRVRATDGHNFSVYSNSATDRVLQEFLTAPRAPSRFKAQVVADGNVRLSWRDNTEVETGFLLERSTDPFGPFVRLKLLPPETTAFIDRSTSAGVHYYYRVRTIDSTTRSAATEVADVTTPSPVKLTITTLEAPGKEDGTTIKFLIRRKSLDGHSFTGGDLLVNYAIGGTATNGVDYDSLDGTILIPDGEATVQLIVSPFDDTLPEGNETVSVTLLGGRGYKISPNGNKQTAEIEDDDFIDASSKVASIFGKKSINSAIDLVDLS